jgi:hypothetical protein
VSLEESVAQGTSASARSAQLPGHGPDGLRDSNGDPQRNGVPVPPQVIDRLDEGITRVRAEIAVLKDQVAGPPDIADGEDPLDTDAGPDRRDHDQACMVALNMALNGASRDETDRYLEESFGLGDRQRIVDGAYARVGRLRRGGRPPNDWSAQ